MHSSTSTPDPSRGTRRVAAWRAVAVSIALCASPACARQPSSESVTPLEPTGAGAASEPDRRRTDLGIADGSSTTTEAPRTTSPMPEPAPVPPTSARSIVDDVLGRYASALTRLSGDPLGASSSDHPVVVEWHSVVAAGSVLSADLIDAVTRRAAADGVVILPGPDGVTHRHRAVMVDEPLDGSIAFTWCGYSAGVATRIDTGEVVDDALGHSEGTGRIDLEGDRWLLTELEQATLDVLPPGSPDPCPQAAAAAGGAP